MIGYPNKKKIVPKVNNYANLGMTLESDIDETNRYYRSKDIAIIHKKPTPIQVVNVSYPARNKAKIVEAYYRTPSTTDFNGIYKGKYIDFDAKETNSKTSFPLSNIHEHQINHLQDVKKHQGIAFLIIKWSQYDEHYIIFIDQIIEFWNGAKEKGRKSIPYQFFKDHCLVIPFNYQPRLDYLKIIDSLI
ncbi:Holliday junction resolvase recU [Acholeplasma oculi]|uniref:Holliday junction resolvase RecU n=1 Tax=Acholeplasma oculi TaxID=35623 RepID=A0A061AJ44_9MOLU|nr:Holliday junction resolvase RecU [Acholeplasma oculi]CDR31012.1 Holliday junction resolvase RecU [Acholeplasma oculi]SKC36300.1 recombination protein U [Acholeplasma oculi]SUT90474.1 Holliday junction resolvase recU [Acholeplasma oculi]